MLEPEPEKLEPSATAIDRAPLIYVNWIQGVPGPFDLALDLGYWSVGTDPRPAVRVAMTWEHAKLLQHLVNNLIEQREGNVGEIKLPPGVDITARPMEPPSDTTDEGGE